MRLRSTLLSSVFLAAAFLPQSHASNDSSVAHVTLSSQNATFVSVQTTYLPPNNISTPGSNIFAEVGLDTMEQCNNTVRAGIEHIVGENGVVSSTAFWKWGEDSPNYINFDFSGSNCLITLNLTASGTNGTMNFTQEGGNSTGLIQIFSSAGNATCGGSAFFGLSEVSSFNQSYNIPLSSFSAWTFQEPEAEDVNGVPYPFSPNGTIQNIIHNNTNVTEINASSNGDYNFTYTGQGN